MMPIKFDYAINSNSICISTQHDILGELLVIEKFYFQVLCKLFLFGPIKIITKDPKEYSFTQGIGESHQLKVGGNILINEVGSCDTNLLFSISQSEEFRRGLLILVKLNAPLDREIVADILKISDYANLPIDTSAIIACCQDDGNTLFLYNSKLSLEYLQTLSGIHS